MEDSLDKIFKPEIKSATRAHKSCISSISVNSDKTLVATSSGDGSIAVYVYLADKKQLKFKYRLCGHTLGVNCVAFHPNFPHLLASCSDDMTVKIWDISKECSADSINPTATSTSVSLVSDATHTFNTSHSDYVINVQWCSIRDYRLFSCSADDTIVMYDMQNNTIGQTFRGHLSTPTFAQTVQRGHSNPAVDIIMSTSLDGTIRFWDPLTGSLLKTAACSKAQSEILKDIELAPIASAILAPNHRFLLTYCLDKRIRLWKVADLLPSESAKANCCRVYDVPINTPYITSLAWGDLEKGDKKYRPFVMGCSDGKILIGDLANANNTMIIDHYSAIKHTTKSPILAVATGIKNVILTGDSTVDLNNTIGSFVNLWCFE